MKNLLTLLLVFSCIFVYAQGPQIAVTVPTASKSRWGYQNPATEQGWLYLPADYGSTTKRYPVVLFYHGSGKTDLNSLLTQGLTQVIAQGMRPDNIVSPKDGLSYSFIVLSLLDPTNWSPDAATLPSALRWLTTNYRINTDMVYVTGLSAGGTESLYTVISNDSISKLVAAAAPMSTPPSVDTTNFNLLNTYKIKTWFFAGTTDSYTAQGSVVYNRVANRVYPGSSTLTLFNAGHCCWNPYYDINYKDPVLGVSIWQWFLTNAKSSGVTLALPVKFKSIQLKRKS